MGKFVDLSGQRFGSWTVLRLSERISKDNGRYWLCCCDCGAEREVSSKVLRSGDSASCGRCDPLGKLHHGPEYRSWAHMKERCDNPNSSFYKNYGARGIGYDPRWSTFMPFYRDMGPRPVGLTLERVDTDADYSKENCIWGTWREQQNNRRNNIRVTLDGETLSLTQWCRRLDLDYSAVWASIGSVPAPRTSPAVHARRRCPYR
jgi:hypothetical protein